VEHLPPEEQLALLAGLVHRVEVMVALRWPTIAEARHGYLTRVELDAKQRPRQEPPACSRLHR
jgi:hypothetical protein